MPRGVGELMVGVVIVGFGIAKIAGGRNPGGVCFGVVIGEAGLIMLDCDAGSLDKAIGVPVGLPGGFAL